MTNLTLKSIVCATLIATGLSIAPAAAASPVSSANAAQAQTPLVTIHHKKRWGHGPRHGHFSFYYGPRAPRHFQRRCSVRKAVRKASRWGVRHARVVWANHRAIKVRGRKHRHRVVIKFGRAPGCPVLAAY